MDTTTMVDMSQEEVEVLQRVLQFEFFLDIRACLDKSDPKDTIYGKQVTLFNGYRQIDDELQSIVNLFATDRLNHGPRNTSVIFTKSRVQLFIQALGYFAQDLPKFQDKIMSKEIDNFIKKYNLFGTGLRNKFQAAVGEFTEVSNLRVNFFNTHASA